jgi:hypothetical protein
MKRQWLALLTSLIVLAATQTGYAQVNFGVRAGINFQNITGKASNGSDLNNSLKTGFHVGALAEIEIAPDYFVQPGLLFSTKGAKSANDSKINLSYLEIPVNFLYKPALGTGKMLLGFGPYLGVGVGGSVETPQGNKVDIEFNNSYSSFSAAPTYRRMDAGANFLAGYEFSNKFSFQLNAQLGLIKTNPNFTGVGNDESNYKNTGFGISVGYRF